MFRHPSFPDPLACPLCLMELVIVAIAAPEPLAICRCPTCGATVNARLGCDPQAVSVDDDVVLAGAA